MLRRRISFKWLTALALAAVLCTVLTLVWTVKATSLTEMIEGHVYEWKYKDFPWGREWYKVPVEDAYVWAWDGETGDDWSDGNGFFQIDVAGPDWFHVRATKDDKYTNTAMYITPVKNPKMWNSYFQKRYRSQSHARLLNLGGGNKFLFA